MRPTARQLAAQQKQISIGEFFEKNKHFLGFDTPHSMDHDWGPSKLDLFLEEEACDQSGQKIATVMTDSLPHEFHDLPVDFEDPGIDGGTIKFVAAGPVSHQIKVTTVRRFFEDYIGLHPLDGLDSCRLVTHCAAIFPYDCLR